MIRLFAVACFSGLFASGPAEALLVSSIDWSLRTRATEVNVGENLVLFNTALLPASSTDTATATGGLSTGTTIYDFQADADSAVFDFMFSGSLASDQTDNITWVQFAGGFLSFDIVGPDPFAYEVSGFFSADGPAQIISTGANLDDITNCTPTPGGCFPRRLLDAGNSGSDQTDAEIVLGVSGGNQFNGVSGSLSGLLVPGATHFFSYDFFLQDDDLTPVAVEGGLRLTLSRVLAPEPVPAPGSALLLASGFAALLARARLRRRRSDA